MSAPLAVYKISQNYRKVTVFLASKMTKHVMCTIESVPSRGLTRQQRYESICETLQENGIVCPNFKEKNSL